MNLLGLDRNALTEWIQSLGEKAFRAQQIFKWIHAQGVNDFANMTNLSKALQEKLKRLAVIEAPRVLSHHRASDGTQKWLFHVEGGSAIETVYIPEPQRATLCISSQVGCALNCRFCHTAQQGFQRNLTASEIIGQLWYVSNQLKQEGLLICDNRAITNIVFMGMGEPLLNFDNVHQAIQIMLDDFAYGLSKRRVTVSTSGVVPAIDKLAEVTDVALAVSLHAPNDLLRSEIVPINKKYPISQLLAACNRYLKAARRRRITMEYVMLKNVNDQPEHAKQLAKLLQQVPSKVNLIPFNPFLGTSYQRSDEHTILQFQELLMASGIVTTIRKTRGDDIDAACGQLAGQVNDRTQRSQRFKESLAKTISIAVV